MLQPTYIAKTFLDYTYDHCGGEFRKFLVFLFSSEKKLCFMQEINEQTQTK